MLIGSTRGRGNLGEDRSGEMKPFEGVVGEELTRDCGGEVVSNEGAIVIIAVRGKQIMVTLLPHPEVQNHKIGICNKPQQRNL